MTEDINGFLVYFVVEGPVLGINSDGVWQCEAKVSPDGGKTVRSMVFMFDSYDSALKFKNDVNNQMEPMVLGEEEDE